MSLVIRQQNAPRRRRKGRRRGGSVVVQATSQSRRAQPGKRKRKGGKNRARRVRGKGRVPQYMRSLLDPENNMARIPDMTSWKSAVFQQVYHFDITSSSDGAAGLVFSPTAVTPSSTNYHMALIGNAVETTVTVGVWGASTSVINTGSAQVAANFVNFRPVSGCVCGEYVGDTSTDAGTICCLPLLRGEAAPVKLSDAQNVGNAVSYPLRNGVRMLFRPLDNGDLEYTGGGDPAGTNTLVSVSYGMQTTGANTVPKNNSPIGERCPPAFCIMVSGATASKKVLRVRAVINFEAIPLTSSVGLFSTAHEPSNPTVLSSALNMAAELPWGEAWQGLAGTAARIGSEMAQNTFNTAGNMAGAFLLQKMNGWRTSSQGGGIPRAIAYSDPWGLD